MSKLTADITIGMYIHMYILALYLKTNWLSLNAYTRIAIICESVSCSMLWHVMDKLSLDCERKFEVQNGFVII